MNPDLITLQRIENIHPKLKAELKQIYSEICQTLSGKLGCRFVQVFRTFAEQDALYAQGRNGNTQQKVTDAKGGQSYHNYGLGVDACLIYDKDDNGKISSEEIIWSLTTDLDKDLKNDWQEIVSIFKKYGWKWGGDRITGKDMPHFDKTLGYSWKQLLALKNAGKIDSKGYVLI